MAATSVNIYMASACMRTLCYRSCVQLSLLSHVHTQHQCCLNASNSCVTHRSQQLIRCTHQTKLYVRTATTKLRLQAITWLVLVLLTSLSASTNLMFILKKSNHHVQCSIGYMYSLKMDDFCFWLRPWNMCAHFPLYSALELMMM